MWIYQRKVCKLFGMGCELARQGAAGAVEKSRKAVGEIKQRLFCAFAYSVVPVPAAACTSSMLAGMPPDPIYSAVAMMVNQPGGALDFCAAWKMQASACGKHS